MNFKDDPSRYYHQNHYFDDNRYSKGIYRELSKTSTYTSTITAGLWRLFGYHIPYNDSVEVLYKLIKTGVNHFANASTASRVSFSVRCA